MKQAGFTIIELAVTMLVIGIVVTLTAPAFSEFLMSQRRIDAAQQLASGIRTARTEAILRSQPVVIRAIDKDWGKGWQIVVDPKGSEDDLVLTERTRSGKVPIFGNRHLVRQIRFNPLGVPAGNGALAGTLFICDTKEAVSHHAVVMAWTGRVRIESETKPEELCG
ncbi:GspH/FimT family pseudopilin [Pseudomonas quasicaspiana]|uniref:GspH/FimT family pseudopilin n=1 Tax=Pseudomonas quasicaspiana TaxID=2829821 RepID=UPI001E49CBF5|nr:GspH/FimT family protein [Pseudomonas quasicaspiana]MCD5972293.1 GspH/FimT family protein [Pseudomonas quasicaspiana]